MKNNFSFHARIFAQRLVLATVTLSTPCLAEKLPAAAMTNQALATQLQVGDVVFIRVAALPFQKIADTTQSWTNHVGVVLNVSGTEPIIAESRFPFSGQTTWSRFVARSEAGRVGISRVHEPLNEAAKKRLNSAVIKRTGIFYDTGFDLHSSRQFCSRYVREVLEEAINVKLGEVENFTTLLHRNPQTDQTFWRVWYFGNIPWQRETVTPASLLNDTKLQRVFDGYVSL